MTSNVSNNSWASIPAHNPAISPQEEARKRLEAATAIGERYAAQQYASRPANKRKASHDFGRRYLRDEDYPDGPEGCPPEESSPASRPS